MVYIQRVHNDTSWAMNKVVLCGAHVRPWQKDFISLPKLKA